MSGPSMSQGALVSFSVRSTTGPAPQAITERGCAPSFGNRRFDRLGEAGIILGLEMDGFAERRVRLALQGEPDVGAADVADQHGKRKSEVAHVGINEEPARAVKRSRKIGVAGYRSQKTV